MIVIRYIGISYDYHVTFTRFDHVSIRCLSYGYQMIIITIIKLYNSIYMYYILSQLTPIS